MANVTDPAREFADMCRGLREASTAPGHAFLSQTFGLRDGSCEFWKIVHCINRNSEQLQFIVNHLTDVDQDIKIRASSSIQQASNAFGIAGLTNQWDHSVRNFLADANLDIIFMLSGYVRQNFGYNVPSGEEVEEFSGMVDDLISWLKDHSLENSDFIRMALIEGLESLLFSIRYAGWMGWSQSFESLKSVVIAYNALVRDDIDASVVPAYAATMAKVSEFIAKAIDKLNYIKRASDSVGWVLTLYGGAELTLKSVPIVQKLITHVPH